VIDIEQVIKEVAERTGVDKEIVSQVCKHVFDQTVDVMKDEVDTRNILFNQLFKFKLKRRYKDDKSKEYSTK